VPGSVYAGHRLIDVLIHGWDVASATGQPTRIDPSLIETCWQVVRPQLSLLQGSGAFGVETTAGADADADPQTSLLMALGRHP
jgi:uncharacterized protein (TIGR03086 family)